jgi:hypothetical protein
VDDQITEVTMAVTIEPGNIRRSPNGPTAVQLARLGRMIGAFTGIDGAPIHEVLAYLDRHGFLVESRKDDEVATYVRTGDLSRLGGDGLEDEDESR